jgi:hypothetical protein
LEDPVVKRLLEHNPFSGQTLIEYIDRASEEIVLVAKQDVSHHVEATKAMFNGTDERAPFRGDMVRVASIPAVVMDQLFRDGIAQDPERFKAWLNDPDNRVFRTRPGRV